MKILVVHSGNILGVSPFISEQIKSLRCNGLTLDTFQIRGKGLYGYLSNISSLRKRIRKFSPDIVHAHYGFSGLLCVLQKICPVVITFHGSDINNIKNLFFSFFASLFSSANIIVDKKMGKFLIKNKTFVIPCGVDLDVFNEKDSSKAKTEFDLDKGYYYALFSSSFDRKIKNYKLAKDAIDILNFKKFPIKLLELKNLSRERVSNLLNAVDIALLTSFSEGSPQFIKEAMATNCKIISTDVGDVKKIFSDSNSCLITSYCAEELASKIKFLITSDVKADSKNYVQDYDLDKIAKQIILVYKKILS
tara:strand:- start:5382 stop:6299 length:918 start_codon:yes stop_codon:yes gene_type:complete